MRRFILFFTLVFNFINAAASDDEPIVVSLETESELMPLYLGGLVDSDGSFDPSYAEKLRKVLEFDLNYNGMTKVVPQIAARDKRLREMGFDDRGNTGELKGWDVYFVIKGKIAQKKLSVRLLVTNNGAFKAIDNLELTGNLAADRRQIHFLADRIFKDLFNEEGIASTKVLFTIKTKNGGDPSISEVYEADYDGGNIRPLTKNAGYVVTPAYIAPKPGYKAGSFMYVSYKNGQPKIFYSSLNEFNPIRFSLLKGNQLMPAISRQRDKVAFVCDITGNPDLFLQPINADGTPNGKPSQIFATHKATQGTPTFSPDGKEIAFVSNKDGSPRIYKMPIPKPGTKLQDIKAELLTRFNRENTAPTWSPDGTKIAYTALTNGVRQIWIYDLQKRKEWQLTRGSGNKENPTWAPNSLHIMFNTTETNKAELYLINLNQAEAVKITGGSGEKRFPSWEPRS